MKVKILSGGFQEVFCFYLFFIFLLLLPSAQNVDMMAGALSAILDMRTRSTLKGAPGRLSQLSIS